MVTLLETGVEPDRFIETIGHRLLDRVLSKRRSIPLAVALHSLPPFLRMVLPLRDARRSRRPRQPEWTNSALDVAIEPLLVRGENIFWSSGSLLIDNHRLRALIFRIFCCRVLAV